MGGEEPPLGVHVRINWISVGEPEDFLFFCPEGQEVMDSVRLVAYSSDEYTIPGLYFIPEFKRAFERLFPDRAVVPHLVRYLFFPNNFYWNRITRSYNAYLGHHRRHVGLQVRTFYKHDHAVNPRIFACLTNVTGILPQVLSREEWLRATTEAQSFQNEALLDGRPRASTSVTVASLHRHHVDYLQEIYLDSVPRNGEEVAFYQASAGTKEKHFFRQHEEAIVEIYLLSFSDDLVISEWSTFGAVAAALSGHRPYFLNIVYRYEVAVQAVWFNNSRPVCARGTHETCFHIPPRGLEKLCPSAEPHRQAVLLFLKPCWDGQGLTVVPLPQEEGAQE
eukprot:TRINITY_DN8895_c0_g2_i1.p1 TRINITY_DN8895_c0_g2~~TRINITY_DN8895_c0_g2_i1.p1  ORF type:complete len:358 (+),score=57.63 TRINITY_DN8895_c0_g2_i1:71-1075(+)